MKKYYSAVARTYLVHSEFLRTTFIFKQSGNASFPLHICIFGIYENERKT